MMTEGRQPNLLLVEDSEDDFYFFSRTLQKSGMNCILHRSADGAEAIEFLETVSKTQSVPPIMFLDLKMPVLNGFEVLDWLQTQPFASQIRVIALSGSERQDDKDRAAKLGATEYLVKPIKVADFHRLLRDLCPATPEIGAHV
jgi:CheY-like chemotaxis protein